MGKIIDKMDSEDVLFTDPYAEGAANMIKVGRHSVKIFTVKIIKSKKNFFSFIRICVQLNFVEN